MTKLTLPPEHQKRYDQLLLDDLIDQWVRKLNLKHWEVRISKEKPTKGNLMEVAMNYRRKHAAIRVSDKVYTLSKKEKEEAIIHELLHLVFYPIAYEHAVQAKQLPPDRIQEYVDRHDHTLEQAVEHLAHVLYALQSK